MLPRTTGARSKRSFTGDHECSGGYAALKAKGRTEAAESPEKPSQPGDASPSAPAKEGEFTPSSLVAARSKEAHAKFDRTLRPRTFADYIGQTKHKDNLSVFVKAARQRGEPLDHMLLSGPPGLGKTTLALILAHEMGVQLVSTSGPVIEPP